MSFKLLTETPARNEEFEYIVEEKNTKEPSTLLKKINAFTLFSK